MAIRSVRWSTFSKELKTLNIQQQNIDVGSLEKKRYITYNKLKRKKRRRKIISQKALFKIYNQWEEQESQPQKQTN